MHRVPLIVTTAAQAHEGYVDKRCRSRERRAAEFEDASRPHGKGIR